MARAHDPQCGRWLHRAEMFEGQEKFFGADFELMTLQGGGRFMHCEQPPTMTHAYMRHGTVTLFAALVQLSGKLIARTEASHTHVEWLRFLKQIDRETPPDLDLHLIAETIPRTNIRR
jgi:hypothetical protein